MSRLEVINYILNVLQSSEIFMNPNISLNTSSINDIRRLKELYNNILLMYSNNINTINQFLYALRKFLIYPEQKPDFIGFDSDYESFYLLFLKLVNQLSNNLSPKEVRRFTIQRFLNLPNINSIVWKYDIYFNKGVKYNLLGHSGAVNTVSLLSNNRIVTGSDDYTIKV